MSPTPGPLPSWGAFPALARPDLDAVTEAIAGHLDVPRAQISIVSSAGQVIPGAFGLPEQYRADRSTPLSHSICQHVVRSDEPLLLPDLAADPAFAYSAAVVSLHLQAHAAELSMTESASALNRAGAASAAAHREAVVDARRAHRLAAHHETVVRAVTELAGVASVEVAAAVLARLAGERWQASGAGLWLSAEGSGVWARVEPAAGDGAGLDDGVPVLDGAGAPLRYLVTGPPVEGDPAPRYVSAQLPLAVPGSGSAACVRLSWPPGTATPDEDALDALADVLAAAVHWALDDGFRRGLLVDRTGASGPR